MRIWGHRGICNKQINGTQYVENSRLSIKKALTADQIYGIECDVHQTQDKQCVVIHDPVVNGIKISDHTLTELRKKLDPNLPTLFDIINDVGPTGKALNIEIKSKDTAQTVIQCCDQAIANGDITASQLLISSFDTKELEIIAKFSSYKIALLADSLGQLEAALERAKNWPVEWLHIHKDLVRDLIKQSALLDGYNIGVYTYDSIDEVPSDDLFNIQGLFLDNPFHYDQ